MTKIVASGHWRDVGQGLASPEGDFVDWLTIRNRGESVTSDVRRIRSHPLVPRDTSTHGFIFDVRSGRLVEVPEAKRYGMAAWFQADPSRAVRRGE
jgi:carbonic anhydrase